ncbi:MAG: TonB-dependent receptor [Bacteroidota bacterium]|nr:TonB-dependent receptor [Bacteroidota bacterium]
MRLLLAVLALMICSMGFAGGKDVSPKIMTVSGYVKDAASGEVLIGASVYISGLKTGTATNSYGFYSLSLKPGKYNLIFSYIGYSTIVKTISLNSDITLNAELATENRQLDAVVVSAEKPNHNITRPEMSVDKMPMQTIKRIPALLGEVDVIKALQLLPGVQSTSEGTSAFSVRGGGADQNLILLDEAVVYNASHLMGFFSVFNNDAVKDVALYKGDIPASFGGRLSSVLDVRMKDGNSKKFSGNGGIGLISSRLMLEGPIFNDKTSFVVAGRRTYADLFLPLASNKDIRHNRLYFYDMNLKLNHQINENNRLYLSGYFGRDVFKNEISEMNFGNQTFTLRWNHLFSKKVFSNLSIIHSRYDYMLSTSDNANGYEWWSNMSDESLKMDFSYFLNPKNTLKYGFATTYHGFNPGKAKRITDGKSAAEVTMSRSYALEHGIYLSDQQSLGKFTIKSGLRFSLFQDIGPGTIYHYDANYNSTDSTVYARGKIYKQYSGWEPRLGINYTINPELSLKASYSRTYQFIQLASNSTAGMPLDVWFPASPNVRPQEADQFATGIFHNFFNNKLETSVEVYYKNMQHVIDYKDNATLLLNKKMEGELRFGNARAYGLEMLLKKNEGRCNGWISLTLSKAERKIPEIFNGKYYPSPYDKPVNLAVVFNYDFTPKMLFSANWLYATGTPVTYPTGGYEYGNVRLKIYSARNAYRMPDYHRLDLSLTLKGKEKPGRFWHGEWVFSVYNAYGRHNAWAINFVEDKNEKGTYYAQKIYLFSFIPSITYNFNF